MLFIIYISYYLHFFLNLFNLIKIIQIYFKNSLIITFFIYLHYNVKFLFLKFVKNNQKFVIITLIYLFIIHLLILFIIH